MDGVTDDLVMSENLAELTKGFPSQSSLVDTGKYIKQAAMELQSDITTDKTEYLAYGPVQGSSDYRGQLATFLSESYGDKVDSSSLCCTAGASQGLSLVASIFLQTGSVVFVEDPTYFIAIQVLRDELNMQLHPVKLERDGLDTVELDRIATKISEDVPFTPTPQRPFRALVYMVPTCHNPTGICYSPDKCRKMIQLARKHRLLLFCDDVYNLLHFCSGPSPPRLLTFDNRTDPDYQGNVISNGTFAKYMAPGLRLGWIEAGPQIIDILVKSKQVWSGGCVNHYTAEIMAVALQKGFVRKHVAEEKEKLKEKMNTVADVLERHLPKGVTFERPQGGYFFWLRLPENCIASEVAQHSKDEYSVTVIAGNLCSPTGSHANYIRIAFSYLPLEELCAASTKLCQAITDCVLPK